jgi:hypothetical protein
MYLTTLRLTSHRLTNVPHMHYTGTVGLQPRSDSRLIVQPLHPICIIGESSHLGPERDLSLLFSILVLWPSGLQDRTSRARP